MKTYRWIAAAALLTLMALPLAAQEKEQEPLGHAKSWKEADTDKDGVLSLDEIKAQQKVYEAEREKLGEDWEAWEKFYEKWGDVLSIHDFLVADANDDHKLTRAEYDTWHKRTYTKHVEGPMEPSEKDMDVLAEIEVEKIWAELEPYDADKDGKLSKAELAQYLKGEMKKRAKAAKESGAHPVEPPMPDDEEGAGK